MKYILCFEEDWYRIGDKPEALIEEFEDHFSLSAKTEFGADLELYELGPLVEVKFKVEVVTKNIPQIVEKKVLNRK